MTWKFILGAIFFGLLLMIGIYASTYILDGVENLGNQTEEASDPGFIESFFSVQQDICKNRDAVESYEIA